MYTEKYEEFQTTLKKSNQVFESFRTEMDKVNKAIFFKVLGQAVFLKSIFLEYR